MFYSPREVLRIGECLRLIMTERDKGLYFYSARMAIEWWLIGHQRLQAGEGKKGGEKPMYDK